MTRNERRLAEKRIQKFPKTLTRLPTTEWPAGREHDHERRVDCFHSREYFVQVFVEEGGVTRLSVNSTRLDSDGMWEEGMPWQTLMQIKRQCGFGDQVAVEVYPDDKNIVNNTNMRHLWILPEAPAFMWKTK